MKNSENPQVGGVRSQREWMNHHNYKMNNDSSAIRETNNESSSNSSSNSLMMMMNNHTTTTTTTTSTTTEPVVGDHVDVDHHSKTPSASNNSHSLAEKRRRDRINAQLASLRNLIPMSDKMDKAALLGSVIEQVKDLKRKASEISKNAVVPTEIDEVTIDMDVTPSSSNSCIFIRASLCCDDRPELYAELMRVLKGLKLTTVRADITSVGGRTRSILVLCSNNSNEAGFNVSALRNSLKVVLSRIASASMANSSSCRSIRSRRQRFFFP